MDTSSRAPLPSHANLEHLRKQAKALLRAVQQGEPEAIGRVKPHVRRLHGVGDRDIAEASVTLTEAQLAVARTYGFADWATMKKQIQAQDADRLCALGLPADPKERLEMLRKAIRENDEGRVKLMLDADPKLAEGGDDEERPITEAAAHDRAAIIDLLVDAGASLERRRAFRIRRCRGLSRFTRCPRHGGWWRAARGWTCGVLPAWVSYRGLNDSSTLPGRLSPTPRAPARRATMRTASRCPSHRPIPSK